MVDSVSSLSRPISTEEEAEDLEGIYACPGLMKQAKGNGVCFRDWLGIFLKFIMVKITPGGLTLDVVCV